MFVIRYVPDQYKTQEICNNVIPENGGTSMFFANCYKIKRMRNKAVDSHADTSEFVPDCYKTQKLCDKAVKLLILLLLQYNLFLNVI